jgi:hypothetical protein
MHNVIKETISISSVFVVLVTLILTVAAGAQGLNAALRGELLAMEKVDQDARMKCVNGSGDEQVNCLMEIAEKIDTPNTKRLEAIYEQYGFPDAKLVGNDGFKSFMILLQHCFSDDLRKKCLRPIRKAFKQKELSALDYANFTDRLLLHRGKPQIYGSGFETKDGRLVMSKTKDIKNLDKRRVKIGLPPIGEYIKVLKEMYHLEVDVGTQPE